MDYRLYKIDSQGLDRNPRLDLPTATDADSFLFSTSLDRPIIELSRIEAQKNFQKTLDIMPHAVDFFGNLCYNMKKCT